jgi:3-methylcrotonyl-CoA carboxylase alpha subunit
MFTKVLIANRGEIAVRIIRALQEMGILAVAVYSQADVAAPHVLLADEAYPLDGVSSAETYLDQEKILSIARGSGAAAIHPGYGFLSENAGFAARVEAAGLRFIGPPASAIQAMGDKIAARQRMQAAGVPVVPGWEGDIGDFEAAREAAAAIGYPVLVKAAVGGGGKGMRRVEEPDALPAAIAGAAREAARAFGDPRLFLEKWISRPRHVEIQVFGDETGQVIHLFERECSIQRRHQKIIEESPSPALDAALRARMGAAAVAAARAVGYRNAGTVEFLLDDEGNFYFLEMNTRLQVEHPVTEFVTGRDLVQAQVAVAAGRPLPFTQEDLHQTGHAFECRIYAEDTEREFLPTTGTLSIYREPAGPGIRVDSGVRQGSEVTVHYDPLLAKLIVWAEDRPRTLRKLRWALSQYVLLGVVTNLPFLRRLVDLPAFAAGELHTGFLEEHPVPAGPAALSPEAQVAAAVALSRRAAPAPRRDRGDLTSPAANPWLAGGPWRLH